MHGACEPIDSTQGFHYRQPVAGRPGGGSNLQNFCRARCGCASIVKNQKLTQYFR